MAAGIHGIGDRGAESNFRLERTGFAGRSPGALEPSYKEIGSSGIHMGENVGLRGRNPLWERPEAFSRGRRNRA